MCVSHALAVIGGQRAMDCPGDDLRSSDLWGFLILPLRPSAQLNPSILPSYPKELLYGTAPQYK